MPTVRKKSSLTIRDLFRIILDLKTTQIVYVLLLVAVFLIGYLLARVQLLEKGVTGQAAVQAPTAGQAPGQAPGQPNQPTPPNPTDIKKKLTLGHLPVKGNQNAKVTIVEFSDFQCPFCEKFFTDSLPQIRKDYIDTGKVKLTYRQFPLIQLHPNAYKAASASECANGQGKFWEYHDLLFQNQAAWSNLDSTGVVAKFKEYAGTLGLDTGSFSSCLDSDKYKADIDKDIAEGQAVGVSGTPTSYINGTQIVGAQPYAAFKTLIDQELAK